MPKIFCIRFHDPKFEIKQVILQYVIFSFVCIQLYGIKFALINCTPCVEADVEAIALVPPWCGLMITSELLLFKLAMRLDSHGNQLLNDRDKLRDNLEEKEIQWVEILFIWFILYSLFHKLISITLDSGIDVAPGINLIPGTFGKNIKHTP